MATQLGHIRLVGKRAFIAAILCVGGCGALLSAQSPLSLQDSAQPAAQNDPFSADRARISGTIVDPSGAAIPNARVQLKREDPSGTEEMPSGSEGQFSFSNLAPGPFQLMIAAEGFAAQSLFGTLREGESYSTPRIILVLAAAKTEVDVVIPRVEIAEAQIKDEEKQRVLGFLPNFYASYVPDAAPLTTKQKFKLAWKSTFDPVTLILTGAVAGIQQAANSYKEYGQGAQGYGKRYGADFADSLTSTFIGSAILPSAFKQDPRYFYKGTGGTRSRIFYAIEMAVVCRGDNGRLQANYSAILGSLAAGGISNLYYPANDRNRAAVTFENTAIGLGTTAAANILQEFVIRKLTPNGHNRNASQP